MLWWIDSVDEFLFYMSTKCDYFLLRNRICTFIVFAARTKNKYKSTGDNCVPGVLDTIWKFQGIKYPEYLKIVVVFLIPVLVRKGHDKRSTFITNTGTSTMVLHALSSTVL
jgi:hypothetical protein